LTVERQIAEREEEKTLMNRAVFGSLAPVLALGLIVSACAKQPALTSTPAPTGGPAAAAPAPTAAPATTPEPVSPAASPASRPESTMVAAAPTAERPAPRDFAPVAALRTIHFDFDRSDIRPADAKILDGNAEWLRANPKHLVLIEGHCDERGTNEYNVALGERRAKATMNYLMSRGVAASRMSTISYGEERPACSGQNEKCWSQNRRAAFLAKEQ
jgi:peptidoglycan-associated lipoprotein